MKIKKLLYLLPVAYSLFHNVSCYQFFQDKVDMEIGKNHGSIGDLLYKKATVSHLDLPVQVYVSENTYSNKIFIKWSEVENAKSYRLERAVVQNGQLPDESDFELVKEYIDGTSYFDEILEDPKYNSAEYNNKYFYRIMAQNLTEGIESTFSYPPDHIVVYEYDENGKVLYDDGNPVINTAATEKNKAAYNKQFWGSMFRAPLGIDADKGKSQSKITISWNPVEDAVYYKIFRGQNENGSGMELIGTVRGNTFEYENLINAKEQGIEFYYKVYAQNSLGNDSVASGLAMGYSLKEGAPVAPGTINAVNSHGNSLSEINISWDPVSAADGKTVMYSVYRNSSEDSVYSVVKINHTGTSVQDKNKLKSGVYYYYYVQTIVKDEATGEILKSSFSEIPVYGYILSAPDSVEVIDGNSSDKVFLQWSPAINNLNNDAQNEYKYNIKCADNSSGPYSTYVTVGDECYDSEKGMYIFETEKKAFYRISTVCEAFSLESTDSAVFAPIPEAPVNVNASKCSRAGMSDAEFVKNSNEVYPVKITWQKPVTDNPAGYNVYRSTKPDSAFRKINDAPVVGTSYIDANDTAKSSVFFYYKVVSVNSLNQGKKSNDPADDPMHNARGYGAITREQWFREYNKNIASSQAKLTLMHKSNDLDKVGSETKEGTISGTVGYNAKVAGLGAEIAMPYKNYADWFIGDEPLNGIKFVLNGNTDTTSNMSANGHMHEQMNCYSYSIDLTGDVGNTFEKLKESTKEKILATGDKNYLVGMYPGYAIYNNLEIKGGAAGGGYYLVKIYEVEGGTKNSFGNEIIEPTRPNSNVDLVDWLIGEEMHK